MKHLNRLIPPTVFVLAFLLFGAPAAPAADIAPTVNSTAYADGTLCYGGYGPDGYCRGHDVNVDMKCTDWLFTPVLIVHGLLHSLAIDRAVDALAASGLGVCWNGLYW